MQVRLVDELPSRQERAGSVLRVLSQSIGPHQGSDPHVRSHGVVAGEHVMRQRR